MAVRWRSLISEYDPPDGFRDIQVSARTIAGITAPQEHDATGAIPPRNLGSRRQQQPAPFVEQAFREFPTCGVLTHGFTRLRCADCSFERLVPGSTRVSLAAGAAMCAWHIPTTSLEVSHGTV
jgi:hypothetical protein